MNRQPLLATLALAFALATPLPGFAQGQVRITAPADGATVDLLDSPRLAYEVDPGPRGDHVHLYVDDKEVAILRKLKGDYSLDALAAGKRNVCVKVVNKAHVPIGVEQCVRVTVK
jgi:hypothetical protein